MLGSSLEELEQEFLRNAEYIKESKGANFLYHTVLSFSRESQPYLNRDIMEDLAGEFLRLYSPDAMAYANVHETEDKQPHLHICHSANGIFDRQRISHSREQYQNIKVMLQEYQRMKYPFLEHSLVRHRTSKEQEQSKDSIKRIEQRGQRPDVAYLQNKVGKAFSTAASRQDFYSGLRASGLELYQYKSRYNGIRYKGRKYRFSRLGLGKEHFLELNKRERYLQRVKELKKLHSRSNGFGRER